MSPYDAYEIARRKVAHLPRRLVRRLDLVAGDALIQLGVKVQNVDPLLALYPDGKTRDRIVAAYEHHLNRTMTKTAERKAAMKYPACSNCINDLYQAGIGGPCATCGDDKGPTNWKPQADTVAIKQLAPIERALATQVGGSHYKGMPIQPVEFITRNKIGFLEGCVIKRVCRWRAKDGVQDLRKAIHELELLIEMEIAAKAGRVTS